MRGICSIKNCTAPTGGEVPTKIHETFEGVEGINICWSCGDKILEVLKEERGE